MTCAPVMWCWASLAGMPRFSSNPSAFRYTLFGELDSAPEIFFAASIRRSSTNRVPRQRLADHLSRLRLTFGMDDVGSLVLQRAFDNELRPFRLLLGDLLRLDGRRVLRAEAQVRDRHVIEENVKVLRPLLQVVPNLPGDLLALRDQLRRVVLRDDRLQRLVDDRRQYAIVVIGAEAPEDGRQLADVGLVQDTERYVDHLHITRSGRRRDLLRLGAHVEDRRRLEPRDHEMHPFRVDGILDTDDPVVHDGAVTAGACEQRVVPAVRDRAGTEQGRSELANGTGPRPREVTRRTSRRHGPCAAAAGNSVCSRAASRSP